jgi:hypothetical protein
MRRNVRRLNREIGHHAASLSNPTAVIPLSVPSSYQPRKQYEKKSTATAAAAAAAAAAANTASSSSSSLGGAGAGGGSMGPGDGEDESDNDDSNTGRGPGMPAAGAGAGSHLYGSGMLPKKSALKSAAANDGTKKKGVRKAVNLSGALNVPLDFHCFCCLISLLFFLGFHVCFLRVKKVF